jgi:hypothetical protein
MSAQSNFKKNKLAEEYERNKVGYYLSPLKKSLYSFLKHLFSLMDIIDLNFFNSFLKTDYVSVYFWLKSSKTSFKGKILDLFVNGED